MAAAAAVVVAVSSGCDAYVPADPAVTLAGLQNGVRMFPESRLDAILDALEGRTYTLVIRRTDAADPTRVGGLDPAASNLHRQLLGHTVGDDRSAPDAAAVVPKLCAELRTTILSLGTLAAPTAADRTALADTLCDELDDRLDALLASGGDLDRFLESEVAPALKGRRNDGDCKGYTVDVATLEFRATSVDLVPAGAEARLSLRIVDPVLRVDVGTYQVSEGSGDNKVCVDRSLVGAGLDIDGRLDLDLRLEASDRVTPFPWRTACGKQLVPSTPLPAESATVPRDLHHGHLDLALDTRAEITKIELDTNGMLVDWAVQWFVNHTKRIRCAFAGVRKAECERSTAAARTIPVLALDTVLPTWGAVLERMRWELVDSAQRVRFDARAGLDPDADRVLTGLDNCPNTANADQADLDYDGVGDTCDPAVSEPKSYMPSILEQQVAACSLRNLSDTFDPRKVYPQLDRRLADPMVLGVKQFWKLQAKEFGFDWSMVVIDETPDRMFVDTDLAFEVTRHNLEILASRWKLPQLKQIELRLIKEGPARRVILDPKTVLPPLTVYQRAVLELAIPDRLVP